MPNTTPSPTNLCDLLDSLQSNVNLVHEFVKGDDTVIVVGTDGSYPSLAKIAKDAQSNISTAINTLTTSEAELTALITNGLQEIANLVSTGTNELSTLNTSIQSAITTAQASISNLITASQTTITNTTNSYQTTLDALVANGTISINKLIADGTTEITNLITNSQTTISTLETTLQTELATLLVNSQNEVNQFITTGQTEVNNLVSTSQSALASLEALGQSDINTLVIETQQAIATNQAALLASENVLASLTNSTGMVAKQYTFPNSLSWHVVHGMKNFNYSISIKNIAGETVWENSIESVDENEFIIKFTEPEAGIVFIIFYLSC